MAYEQDIQTNDFSSPEDFKSKPMEERVLIVTNLFLSDPNATIRTVASTCHLSTKTVHKYLTEKLPTIKGTTNQETLVQEKFELNKGFITDPLKVQRIQAVAAATAKGLTQKQIANELGISLATVRYDSSPERTMVFLSTEEAKIVADTKRQQSLENLKKSKSPKGRR